MSRRTSLVMAALALLVVLVVWLGVRERGAARRVDGSPEGAVGGAGAAELSSAPSPDLLPAAAPREVVPSESGPLDAPVLETTEGFILRLRVLRKDDDQPIPGARITASEVQEERDGEDVPIVAESGADGSASIRVAASARPVHLRVEKEGYFHLNAFFERRAELELRLSAAATIFGRVLAAESGAPVPGARVRLVHGFCKRCEPDEVFAEGSGRYELAGVPLRQSATFVLEAEGFAPQASTLELPSDGPRLEHDFRLERGVELVGRVVDFTSGAGLAGARIGEIVADESGSFRGRVLPEPDGATVDLRVEAEGHSMLSCTLAATSETLEFRLPRGAIVEGTLTDGSGAPIPSAVVRLDEDYEARARGELPREPQAPVLPEGWRYEPEGHHCSARTDEEGRFRIENAVPWSTQLVLRAFADGHEETEREIERVGGPGESLHVELVLAETEPETSLHGEIRLNGAPLRTARGRLRWQGATRAGEQEFESGDFYASVEPGEVVLRVEVDSLPSGLEGSEVTLHAEPGKPLEPVLDLRMPTRPITGRVTFEDGQGAPLAAVNASFPASGSGEHYWDRLHVSTKTEQDGSFALEVPDVPALYRVEASLDEDQRSIDGIRAGASGVELVLTRGGLLQFRLRDARGERLLPAGDFELGWKRPAEDEYHALYLGWPLAPDQDGWYDQRLPGGRLDLRVHEKYPRSGYRAAQETVVIDPRAPCRVEFVLVRGLSVEFLLAPDQVALPEGHAVLLVEDECWDSVKYWPEGNSWDGGKLGDTILQRFIHLERGKPATIRGLGPGRFRFKLFPDDLVLEPAQVELADEPRQPLLVRWRVR